MTPWEIDATEIANCNCAFGCPCQFNSLPTNGNCEAAVGYVIHKGHHGDVSLDGLKVASTTRSAASRRKPEHLVTIRGHQAAFAQVLTRLKQGEAAETDPTAAQDLVSTGSRRRARVGTHA